MSIKIIGDTAVIKVWSSHPLMLGAIERLPSRVLNLLHTGLKSEDTTVTLEEVPVENIAAFIDYQFIKMRTELTRYQWSRKFITVVLAFIWGMGMWMSLYYINADVILTSLMGLIAVIAMSSLFARRFLSATLQDKALHDVYIYLIKEHQYASEALCFETTRENSELRDTLKRLDVTGQEQLQRIRDSEQVVTTLNKQLDQAAQAHNRMLSIYQDLLSNSDQETLEEHFLRCEKYGIEVVYEDDVLVTCDKIQ